MRLIRAFSVRQPLRSLPLAVLILALAERLGEEAAAATELAVREKAALAVIVSQQNVLGQKAGYVTDTILHEAGNVGDLYRARFQTD